MQTREEYQIIFRPEANSANIADCVNDKKGTNFALYIVVKSTQNYVERERNISVERIKSWKLFSSY